MIVARAALLMLVVAAVVVAGVHYTSLPVAALVTAGASGAVGLVRRQLIAGAWAVVCGLTLAWAVSDHTGRREGRILRDLGWAQVALGALVVSVPARRRRGLPTLANDASRARWRGKDPSFGIELAERVAVAAQPGWAALVVEAVWDDDRPAAVSELVERAYTATPEELVALRDRLTGDDARFVLARVACEVLLDARARAPDARGGTHAAQLAGAAAAAVHDDDDAARIFAALVFPAVALEGSTAEE